MACMAALWPTKASFAPGSPRHVKGLEQIIVSAKLGCFDGRISGAKGGRQNNRQARLRRVQLAHQFQPGQPRQTQIGDDKIERIPSRPRQSLVAPPLGGHFMTFVRQHAAQGIADARVIFYQ
jgi:hypothetical protein